MTVLTIGVLSYPGIMIGPLLSSIYVQDELLIVPDNHVQVELKESTVKCFSLYTCPTVVRRHDSYRKPWRPLMFIRIGFEPDPDSACNSIILFYVW